MYVDVDAAVQGGVELCLVRVSERLEAGAGGVRVSVGPELAAKEASA
jgi:hypothetical protein